MIPHYVSPVIPRVCEIERFDLAGSRKSQTNLYLDCGLESGGNQKVQLESDKNCRSNSHDSKVSHDHFLGSRTP